MKTISSIFDKIFLAFSSLLLATSSTYLIFISTRHLSLPRNLQQCFPLEDSNLSDPMHPILSVDTFLRDLIRSKERIPLEDGKTEDVSNPMFPLRKDMVFDIEAIRTARQQVATGKFWKSRSLFVPHPYVCKRNKLIDPFENSENLHSPIPNWWLIKYRLDYGRPDLPHADLKGDGFTVLENYQTDTHPTDPNTHAPPYIKLRLHKVIHTPFRIKFSGTPDDGKTFALNTVDVPFGRTQFLKLGESFQIANTSYLLKTYHHKTYVKDSGLEIDVSELILENDKETIVLYLDKETNFPSSSSAFKIFGNDSELIVKKGEIFVLPQWQEYLYKLVDITETDAVIEDIATGKKHRISKLSPESHE